MNTKLHKMQDIKHLGVSEDAPPLKVQIGALALITLALVAAYFLGTV